MAECAVRGTRLPTLALFIHLFQAIAATRIRWHALAGHANTVPRVLPCARDLVQHIVCRSSADDPARHLRTSPAMVHAHEHALVVRIDAAEIVHKAVSLTPRRDAQTGRAVAMVNASHLARASVSFELALGGAASSVRRTQSLVSHAQSFGSALGPFVQLAVIAEGAALAAIITLAILLVSEDSVATIPSEVPNFGADLDNVINRRTDFVFSELRVELKFPIERAIAIIHDSACLALAVLKGMMTSKVVTNFMRKGLPRTLGIPHDAHVRPGAPLLYHLAKCSHVGQANGASD
mmetsp:Transcript_36224/g.83534  ORF Transcript_36224/g.83534 Transcript_36224/m.83534 type:complete len:293 (+) Transcript_36224:378-1256(+)